MRLDKLLFERGLVPSREKAQALIMAGLVRVGGKVVDKPGYRVRGDEEVDILETPRYVSRGGYKLEGALRAFNLDVKGKVVLDVGSSTGGFTDCFLQHGAQKVYAVDVGRGQMDPKLRNDPRVILYERTDARSLTEKHVPEKVDVISVDVSFISATKVLPSVIPFLKDEGVLLVLVKPQFELSPKEVKKGVVREWELKKKAVLKVANFLESLRFNIGGVMKAFPRGVKGNEEFFLLAGKSIKPVEVDLDYTNEGVNHGYEGGSGKAEQGVHPQALRLGN